MRFSPLYTCFADDIGTAVDSFQLSEICQVNSILVELKLHQQCIDEEIEHAIDLHQRLFTRSAAFEVWISVPNQIGNKS